MYFDGSDVGLSDSSSEDINGVWIDSATGEIYLSTVGSFAVEGSSGDGGDVFICVPSALGETTVCTFGPGLYWDGSANGFGGEVIDGLDVVLKGTSVSPMLALISTPIPEIGRIIRAIR